ncbi:lipopolysaccharide biosynthesis protein [Streptomyces piniterrae]|uniref:Lipopolysaccharide biosynthesis protein n=1 Tax=Streptomyces piniterrae TaxID=2571125 RepID=A0A4V5ML61_9ACTN|nr:lipopolysaccharide biosynthesis protein [Streptomyces piniterrae]TJZ55948.1 lipopolysaccharide biosynthesis protein [Streptomyces piniterrae]
MDRTRGERPRAAARPRSWRRRLPRWWPLSLCALLGAAGGASYGLLAPPQYAATSYVVVVPTKWGDPATALGFAQAYGRVATDGAVLAAAHRVSGLPLDALRGGVRAMTSPDAPVIEITGTAGTPGTSARVANAVAGALAGTGNGTAGRTGAEVLVFSRATVPSAPVSPSVPIATGVGGCAGGLLGGLLLLVRPGERRGTPGAAGAAAVPAPAQGSAPPPRGADGALPGGAPETAEGAVR